MSQGRFPEQVTLTSPRSPSAAALAAMPEGPYEIAGGQRIAANSNQAILKVVEFVAQFRDSSRSLLSIGDMREFHIVLELIRNHVTGRLTTTTSLAHSSGLSHGTAIRTIDELIGR